MRKNTRVWDVNKRRASKSEIVCIWWFLLLILTSFLLCPKVLFGNPFFVICTQVRICWCCLSIKDFWSEKRTCNFVSLFSKNRRWGNVFWSFSFNTRRCRKMSSLWRRTRWGACQTEKIKYSNFWISAMTAMCLIWIDDFCVLLDAKVQHYLVHRAVTFVMFALNPKKTIETQ